MVREEKDYMERCFNIIYNYIESQHIQMKENYIAPLGKK